MLEHLLRRTLDESPDKIILDSDGSEFSARELEDASLRFASRIKLEGCESMDRIAMLLPNCPEAIQVYMACFKGGYVVVPLDYRHQVPQIRYSLHHSGANVLVVDEERYDELAEHGCLSGLNHVVVVGSGSDSPAETFGEFISKGSPASFTNDFAGEDLCVMIYTSGTTSRPKGVTLTRGSVETGIKKYLANVPLTGDDVALVAAPITRPMALRCQLLPMLQVGGRISLLKRFDVEDYLNALQTAPAKSFLAMLPSGLMKIVNHPDFQACPLDALRLCLCGGDRVPADLFRVFREKTGLEITEQCGASEVGPYSLNPPFGRKKSGSIGLPMYGANVCVIDEQGDDVVANGVGEIVVDSPMMMDGYWNDTVLSRQAIRDGWFHTGDLGKFDDDGYLWFMGRKKDTIVRAGSNVSPHEVESVLLQHPAVAMACVVGLLDEQTGQAVHAVVVLKSSEPAPSEDELITFCQGQLANYMIPETIEFQNDLPLKGPGKIDRDMVRIRAEIRPLIENVPFFANVGEEFTRHLSQELTCVEFEAGRWILRQGEFGTSMYFLTRGKVEVVSESQDRSLGILQEGCYFGELAVLKESPRAASIKTIERCEVFKLNRSAVRSLCAKYLDFAEMIQAASKNY